jgi:hypothetical protein
MIAGHSMKVGICTPELCRLSTPPLYIASMPSMPRNQLAPNTPKTARPLHPAKWNNCQQPFTSQMSPVMFLLAPSCTLKSQACARYPTQRHTHAWQHNTKAECSCMIAGHSMKVGICTPELCRLSTPPLHCLHAEHGTKPTCSKHPQNSTATSPSKMEQQSTAVHNSDVPCHVFAGP